MAVREVLSREADQAAPEATLVQKVLVLGLTPWGVKAAQSLAGQGLSVLLAGSAGENFKVEETDWTAIEASEMVEVLADYHLAGIKGWPGRFSVLLAGQDPSRREEVGAVILAEAPQGEVDWAGLGIEPTAHCLALSQAVGKSAADLDLAAGEVVPFLLGLGHESNPFSTAQALNLALELSGEGVKVFLLADNVKVAREGLDDLYNQARQAGTVTFRLTGLQPKVSQEEGVFKLSFFDDIMGQEETVAAKTLIVEETFRPGSESKRLADLLGLVGLTDGWLQPNRVMVLPTETGRVGIHTIGPNRGSNGWSMPSDEAEAAVLKIKIELALTEAGQPHVTLDKERCAVCLTCMRVCPHTAVGFDGSWPVFEAVACQACGTCTAECPMDALQLAGYEDETMLGQVAEAAGKGLVVFICQNSAAKAWQAAEALGLDLPQGLSLIEVPCAGKIDPLYPLTALAKGADGVIVAACPAGACHSLEGNTWASLREEMLAGMLQQIGLETERVSRVEAPANAPAELARQLGEAASKIKALGQNPVKKG
ncbi:MAG: hydrogenase iron-sulfur subunit [Deltaproteobacteria bacterium]|nr:hydrogenase iron-sulfur subunit [Deltaproteobacteria bacterium]